MTHPDAPPTAPSVPRRTLLEWLGRATVVGLASPLLKACAQAGDDDRDATDRDLAGSDGLAAADTTGGDREGGGDAPPERLDETVIPSDPTRLDGGACAPDGRPAASTNASQAVFEHWNVRTVDEQALMDVLTNWQLRIDGLVTTPRTFSFCELLELGLSSQETDFHCVEGWSVYDVPWDGVPLGALLDLVQPLGSATHLSIACRAGIYSESLPLAVAREPKSLLALGVAGHTLPMSHGFPARLVVPRLLGYKNAKFVETITLADHELVGFWPRYGYAVSGEVPAERLRPGKY